jgi:hypothetical protein
MLPTLTGEVERLTGISCRKIHVLILGGRLNPPPLRDAAGRYVWGPDDIESLIAANKIDRRYRKYRKYREYRVGESTHAAN